MVGDTRLVEIYLQECELDRNVSGTDPGAQGDGGLCRGGGERAPRAQCLVARTGHVEQRRDSITCPGTHWVFVCGWMGSGHPAHSTKP